MQRSPLDILVKNFFDKDSVFDRPTRQVVTHPIDVYETIAEVKESDGFHHTYHSGIRRSSFDLGWKISRRFNLSDIKAEMKNGLLTLSVPYSEESKPKSIKIK